MPRPHRSAFALTLALLASCQRAPEPGPAAAPADPAAVRVEAGARFTWPGDPRASLYRIELYDAAGQLLGGAVTGDTAVPADAIVPDTARAGRWRVVPVTAAGSELPAGAMRSFVRP